MLQKPDGSHPLFSDSHTGSFGRASDEVLDEVGARLDFKHWYYGHFHGDGDVDERYALLFERIVPIGAGAGAV